MFGQKKPKLSLDIDEKIEFTPSIFGGYQVHIFNILVDTYREDLKVYKGLVASSELHSEKLREYKEKKIFLEKAVLPFISTQENPSKYPQIRSLLKNTVAIEINGSYYPIKLDYKRKVFTANHVEFPSLLMAIDATYEHVKELKEGKLRPGRGKKE